MFAVLVSLLGFASGKVTDRLAALQPSDLAAADANPICAVLPPAVRAKCPLCNNAADWEEFQVAAAAEANPICAVLPPAVRAKCPLCNNAEMTGSPSDWKNFEELALAAPKFCDLLPPAVRANCPLCKGATSADWTQFAAMQAPGFCNLLPPAVKANCPLCKDVFEALRAQAEPCPLEAQQAGSPICWKTGNYAAVLGNVEMIEAARLAVTWKDCGSGAHASVKSLTPTSMELGTTTTMTGVGAVDETVTGGSFTMSVRAGGGMVHQTFHGKVCEPAQFKIKALGMTMGTLAWEGINCPLNAGPSDVKMSVNLSSMIPRGMASSTIKLEAMDQNGASLICLEVSTK